jgi:hypothetical protein
MASKLAPCNLIDKTALTFIWRSMRLGSVTRHLRASPGEPRLAKLLINLFVNWPAGQDGSTQEAAKHPLEPHNASSMAALSAKQKPRQAGWAVLLGIMELAQAARQCVLPGAAARS